jgi:predicted CopG family antitoxin
MSEATIKLSHETRDRLRAEKVGGETYDDVIQRLLEGEE